MGKGQRSNRRRAEYFREQQMQAAAKEAGLKRTRIIAVAVAAVLLCALAVLVIRAFVRDTRNRTGYYMRNAVVMSNDNVSVDAAEMSYFLFSQANAYLTNYYTLYSGYYHTQYSSFSSFLKAFTGIDTSVSLKTQYRGSVTWFDYFKDLAETEVKNYIALYSKAIASGMSLTDDDIAGIKMRAANTDPTAYGDGINTTDIENALTLKTLADIYKYKIMNDIEINESALNTYFDENYTDYTYIDYLTYSIGFGASTSKAESREEAKELADKLAAATCREQFEAIISEIAGDDAETAVENAEVKKAVFVESEALTKLFDKSTNVFDTYIVENVTENSDTGNYAVYMLLKKPYTDDDKTANLRHILIATYDDDDSGKAEAERIYDLFMQSDMSDDAFGKLARRYSEDITSLPNGGLYVHLQKGGDSAAAFDEWCFGTERQEGDCEVVKTSYGYHVMYFEGYDLGNSMASAYEDLKNEIYLSEVEAIAAEYPITANASAYDTIGA